MGILDDLADKGEELGDRNKELWRRLISPRERNVNGEGMPNQDEELSELEKMFELVFSDPHYLNGFDEIELEHFSIITEHEKIRLEEKKKDPHFLMKEAQRQFKA